MVELEEIGVVIGDIELLVIVVGVECMSVGVVSLFDTYMEY